MAQQVTALVTKPDNLSFTLRRHMIEREDSLRQSRPLTSMCAVAPPTHTQAQRERGGEGERAQSVNKQTNKHMQ